MKKYVSCLLALAMLLSLCADLAPSAAAEEDMALYRTGNPWICTDLDGVVTEDISADVKDHFALAVSQDFYINAVIPEGYSTTGLVDDLTQINAQELIQIFADGNDFSDHDSQLAKAYYDLMLDWDTRNALGVAPLKTLTDVVETMTTLDELIDYFRNCPHEKSLRFPFSASVTTDLIDPDLYIADITSCKVFLKDSAEYEQLTDLGARYLSAYRDLATAMLVKFGYSEERAKEMWEEAYRLDELMAPSIYTTDEQYSPDFYSRVNNHMTRDEVIALQGRLPIVAYLEENRGYGRQENWLVENPGFFEAMQDIFTEENLPLFKSWIICHAVIDNSDILDRECYELWQASQKAITDAEALPDEVIAAWAAAQDLPWQTAHMYCSQFFTQQDKDAMRTIIDDVIATYKEMLLAEDFISEATKAAAITKLDAIRIRNLYPDDWSAYTDPELNFRSPAEGGTLEEAQEAIQRSDDRRNVAKAQRPVDHELWDDEIVPTTVNCFYNPSNNSINILAAFCRGDMYSDNMSHAEICGKIGLAIAHEITHAFDSNGAQFDETGAYRDWWTEEDKALFLEKDKKMADYYSAMSLWDGAPINGGIKTTEACADMGAMKCLLTMAAQEEDFDYDTFFRSYADLWRAKDNMAIVQMYQKDPHSMGYLRINSVLQQFDDFLNFYGITEGDGMYLAPADRVAIW